MCHNCVPDTTLFFGTGYFLREGQRELTDEAMHQPRKLQEGTCFCAQQAPIGPPNPVLF
jgi:hypothetical protein